MNIEQKIAAIMADDFGPLSKSELEFIERLDSLPPTQAHAAAGRELVKGHEDLLRFALTSRQATESIVRLLAGTVELLADIVEHDTAMRMH